MANLIPDGEYYIYNAAASARVIDVSGSQLQKQNAKVQLYDPLYNNAQAWKVQNSGGKLIITSRLFGNRFGPVSSSATAEVKLNVKGTGVSTNVKWDVAAASTTKTIGGKAYNCYYIKNGSNNLYAASTSNNAVLRMSTSTAAQAQWVFVPIDQLEEGGLFEIRPVVGTHMAVDVEAAGQFNGTNVQLWSANGTNAQKFYISKKSGDIYTIRDISSGRYLDVDSAIAKPGTNVQIWDKNNTRAQDWRVLEYGTQKLNGQDCKIVSFGSMTDGTGNTLMMDVYCGQTTLGTNLRIWETNNADAERFVLLPTTAEDAHMPVPHSLAISDNRGGAGNKYGYTTDDSYITWKCSAGWTSDNGANHYEIRYRTRTMNPTTGAWRAWDDWTAWQPPATSNDKQQEWAYVEDMLGEWEWTEAKKQQLDVQLRSCGQEETALVHSKSLSQTMDIYRKPVVDITRAGWTPGGVVLEYSTDYPYGTTYLTIDSIRISGNVGVEILKEPVTLSGIGSTLSGVIDRENLSAFVNDGTSLYIRYRTGYDQQQVCDGIYTDTVQLTYDAGSVDVEPIFKAQGAHLYAYVRHLGQERLWVEHNGTTVECSAVDTANENGTSYTVFDVLYPTNGDDFRTFTEARSLDGTAWGTDVSTVRFRHVSYAWTVDGKTVYLRKFIDALPTYSYSHTATYQTDILDSREFASVSFAPTRTAELTAYGVIIKDDPDGNDATVEDFEALVGKHGVFRDIAGGIHNVAITQVTIDRANHYDNITVTMTEETI